MLNKQLNMFQKDELFLRKIIESYTTLERHFLKGIELLESQAVNNIKMSSGFGQLNQVQRLLGNDNNDSDLSA